MALDLNGIPNYDSWKLSSGRDDEKIFCHCGQCSREIYNGEGYFTIDDNRICEDCLEEYVKDKIAEYRIAMV